MLDKMSSSSAKGNLRPNELYLKATKSVSNDTLLTSIGSSPMKRFERWFLKTIFKKELN